MTDSVRAAALLLDMDGTLVDSRAVVERLWLRWAQGHGLDPERVLAVIHGRQGQESMAELLPDRPHALNLAENELLLAAETAETDGVVAIAGAATLLAALTGPPALPHALVTSATLALATARMDAAGLPMPRLVVSAADVAASKPHPEGFLTAARLLGVDAADCIVVEDSANGIAAGLAAGMRVIGVGPHAAALRSVATGAPGSAAALWAVATGAPGSAALRAAAAGAAPTWTVADCTGIRVVPDAGAIAVTIG
ncbi:HAD-IA family hydrolase [Microbacterium sp.]|uniref:HAD-IA family hydrolase n=1 Tax=Microbacterium sp. TaxID=51671 RepID=UPI0039E32E5D